MQVERKKQFVCDGCDKVMSEGDIHYVIRARVRLGDFAEPDTWTTLELCVPCALDRFESRRKPEPTLCQRFKAAWGPKRGGNAVMQIGPNWWFVRRSETGEMATFNSKRDAKAWAECAQDGVRHV